MLSWLKEGQDQEGLDTIQKSLDKAALIPHPLVTQEPVKFVKTKTTKTEPEAPDKPYTKWQAPPGWRPPGWKNDETAFRNAKAAMGFVSKSK